MDRAYKPRSHHRIRESFQKIDVKNFIVFLPYLLEYFENKIRHFRAGALKKYLSNCHTVTSDSETLETVGGLPIELPVHFGVPNNDGHCSFFEYRDRYFRGRN